MIAGVPQRSALGPVLFLSNTCDISKLENTITATFLDETVILAVGNNYIVN